MSKQQIEKVGWHFDHSYIKLPKDFFVEQPPVKVQKPKLILLLVSIKGLKLLKINSSLNSLILISFDEGTSMKSFINPISSMPGSNL